MRITYLNENNIEKVAKLISEKYQNALITLPILSNKFTNPKVQLQWLKKYLNKNDVYIVEEDNIVIGFMVGIYIDNFKGRLKGALVLPYMHAVSEGYDQNKVYSFLYSKISHFWVENGCYTHCILINVNETKTLNLWFSIGFGMLVYDVVRPLELIDVKENEDVIIRIAEYKDKEKINRLFINLKEHLISSPIFLYDDGENEELIINEELTYIIAEKGDNIIGYLKADFAHANLNELEDGNTVAISGLYVLPEYRGAHISTRLLNYAINLGKKRNYARITSDFETANIEGSGFWLKYFTPFSYGLIRKIDERNYLK